MGQEKTENIWKLFLQDSDQSPTPLCPGSFCSGPEGVERSWHKFVGPAGVERGLKQVLSKAF